MDPPERSQTVRQALQAELTRGPATALELSQALGVPEREVLDHLGHLSRAHGRQKLVVEPARCLSCGFAFNKRARLNRPSRCPACKSERIAPPRFSAR